MLFVSSHDRLSAKWEFVCLFLMLFSSWFSLWNWGIFLLSGHHLCLSCSTGSFLRGNASLTVLYWIAGSNLRWFSSKNQRGVSWHLFCFASQPNNFQKISDLPYLLSSIFAFDLV